MTGSFVLAGDPSDGHTAKTQEFAEYDHWSKVGDSAFDVGASRSSKNRSVVAGSTADESRVSESTDRCSTGARGVATTGTTDCAFQAARALGICASGQISAVGPADASRLDTDGSSGPEPDVVPGCEPPATTDPVAVTVTVTENDFRSMPLVASTVSVGPEGGWLPVNMVVVVYASSDPQILPTTVLGQPVLIRATPTRYTWDFADGSAPLATSDPGAPFPNHTVSYTYSRVGDYVVTLTTTWSGEFSVDGGVTYQPIDGTASTTSTAPSLSVTEFRSQLVDGFVS